MLRVRHYQLMVLFAFVGSAAFVAHAQHNPGAVPAPGLRTVHLITNGSDSTMQHPQPSALKNSPADSVQYVSPTGNDSNDGLSWGTTKQHIDKAMEALPRGNSAGSSAGVGTVYFASGTVACAASNAYGIQIMGPGDPNYASPPNCWVKQGPGFINIIGVGTGTVGQVSNADRNKPAIWLSNVQNGIRFENFYSQYQGRGIVVGECSNNDRTGRCASSTVYFDRVGPMVPTNAGMGPDWDFVSGYWVWVTNSSAEANTSNRPGDDRRAAMLIDGTGIMSIKNLRIGGNAGIKINNAGGVNGVSVDGASLDAGADEVCDPVVWITNTGGTDYDLNAITNADCKPTSYAVEVDFGNATDTKVSGAQGSGANTKGPMIVLSQYAVDGMQFGSDPIVNHQLGFYNNRVLGQTDVARRQLVPQPVQFRNLVLSPSSWTTGNGVNVKTGISGDPAAGRNAVRVSYSGVGYYGATVEQLSQKFSVGDWLIFAGWVRSPDGSFANGVPLQTHWTSGPCVSSFPTDIRPTLPSTATNWQWVYGVGKVSRGGICTFAFGVGANSTHRTDVYGLVVNYISAGTWDEQTVLDYVNNLDSYDSGWTTGTVGGLATTTYAFGSVQLKVYTVSTLPPAASFPAGTQVIVSDASTFTPGTCKGGGRDYMLAISNGSSWSCH